MVESHFSTFDLLPQTSQLLVSPSQPQNCQTSQLHRASIWNQQMVQSQQPPTAHVPIPASMTPAPRCALSEARASRQRRSVAGVWASTGGSCWAAAAQLPRAAAMYSRANGGPPLTTGFKTATQGAHLFRRTPQNENASGTFYEFMKVELQEKVYNFGIWRYIWIISFWRLLPSSSNPVLHGNKCWKLVLLFCLPWDRRGKAYFLNRSQRATTPRACSIP